MESKIEEYDELYAEFDDCYEELQRGREPIEELNKEITKLYLFQKRVDYNDSNAIVGYMEEYVDEVIKAKEAEITNETEKMVEMVADEYGLVALNYRRISKWMRPNKAEACLRKYIVDADEHTKESKVYNSIGLDVIFLFNKILGILFRMDYLKFLPKVLRCVLGFIVWCFLLIPITVENIYDKYNGIYYEYVHSMDLNVYDYETQRFSKSLFSDFLFECIVSIIIVGVGIIILNLVVYVITRYSVKKYLRINCLFCIGIIEPDFMRKTLYESKCIEFIRNTVEVWKNEIAYIKENGLTANIIEDKNSFFNTLKEELIERSNECEEQIQNIIEKKQYMEENLADIYKRVMSLVPRLKEKANEVRTFVSNPLHNNGCLSPYVSLGFSNDEKEGIRELLSYEHGCKPMIICYEDETINNGITFRRNIEIVIERFMEGFYQENYYENINMWLVDFEGLRFPESRTRGLLKVVSTMQGVQEVFDEIKNSKKIVDSNEDGKISTVNPIRLQKSEKVIKYNIVFFVEAEDKITEEMEQLFVQAENFGFLPIVFMKESKVDEILEDDKKSLYKIIKYIDESEQIYCFESVTEDFICNLVISDQKKEVENKILANDIKSFREFMESVKVESVYDLPETLYVDTYGMTPKMYEELLKYENVKYFTIDGDVPDYITGKVMKI